MACIERRYIVRRLRADVWAKRRDCHVTLMILDVDSESTEDCTYAQALLPLLMTNDPPQPSEEVLVQTEVARGQQQLETLDREISTLQATLYSLQGRRGRVKKFVDDHIRILSPLRRACLPPEIITEIFHYFADADHVTCNVSQGIWNLARVCRYWRNIAISSPSLWNHMVIDRTAVLPITQELVARSQGAALTISFTDQNLIDARKHEFQKALSVFMPVSPRWHSVTIDLRSSHHSVFSSIKGHLPVLKTLQFSRVPAPTFDCFSEAPLLEQVTIVSPSLVRRSLAALQFPWTQLRECSLPSSWSLDHLNVLKQCPNVKIVTLGYIMVGPSHPQPSPGDMVRMPKLHTLRIAADNQVLRHLILPSLRSVTIQQYNCWNVESITRLKDCLERSSPRLKVLKLRHSGLLAPQASRATHIFRTVPLLHLTSLILVCDITSPEVINLFSALTIPTSENTTGIVLPCLTHMLVTLLPSCPKLKSIDFIKSNFAALITLAQSRRISRADATSLLTFLRVDWQVNSTLQALVGALEPLVALRDQGLRLNVPGFYLYPAVEFGRAAPKGNLLEGF